MQNLDKNKYPKQCAGRLMTSRVPLIFKNQSIKEVQELLFQKIQDFETINYVYVIDGQGKLIGVVSIKDIFRYPEKTRIADVMRTKIIKARAFTDQEIVAILALKNNLKAIPIVDKNNRFLGVMDSDIILDVLHKENIEDILLSGGITKVGGIELSFKELITAPTKILVKSRLPWLLFGLFGGVIAAQIIGFFEFTLKSQVILAFFIPIVVYVYDAVATQSATILIRGIAFDPNLIFKRYFFREIKIGVALGLISGSLLAIAGAFFWNNFQLGIILFLTIFFAILISTIFAMLIPFSLWKLKKDPIFGSNPLVTILSDLLSVTVYFLIANLIFGIFYG